MEHSKVASPFNTKARPLGRTHSQLPVHRGGRFSANALVPSRASAVAISCRCPSASIASPASSDRSGPAIATRLIVCTATGAARGATWRHGLRDGLTFLHQLIERFHNVIDQPDPQRLISPDPPAYPLMVLSIG